MQTWGMIGRTVLPVLAVLGLLAACARYGTPARHRPQTTTSARRGPAPQPTVPAEIRGVWVSDTTRLDWDRSTAALQRAGFNTMYVNLATAGAAFYPGSKALPTVTGDSVHDLERGLTLAHQRGLRVHAKLIVMFAFKSPSAFHQQLLRQNGVMRGPDGKPILQAGYPWLCPSRTANRALLTAALSEILDRYPVDGVQFDYIRFNENPSCFCSECRRAFEKEIGHPVRRWPDDALTGSEVSQFRQWRVRVIDAWMRDLSGLVRAKRPGLPVSAAVFPDLARAREEKGQDWQAWLNSGQIDYVCPMNYTTEMRSFEDRNRQVLTEARRQRVAVGIGSWKFEQLSSLRSQIDSVRRSGAAGFILFSYDDAAARNFLPEVGSGVR